MRPVPNLPTPPSSPGDEPPPLIPAPFYNQGNLQIGNQGHLLSNQMQSPNNQGQPVNNRLLELESSAEKIARIRNDLLKTVQGAGTNEDVLQGNIRNLFNLKCFIAIGFNIPRLVYFGIVV